MVGFFGLKDKIARHHKETGEAIMRLSLSVNQNTPGSEWVKFCADPKAWLYAAGYRFDGPGAGPNGQIPATVNIQPVYDTENTMHVRIPWKGVMEHPPVIENEQTYIGVEEQDRFPVLLARYFMRQCR